MIDIPSRTEERQRRSHALLGSALAAWSGIESLSGYLFHILTKMERQQASAIFFSARSFNGQLDMLRAAVPFSGISQENIDTTAALLKKISTFYQYRNSLAHSYIAFVSYPKGDLIPEASLEIRSHFKGDFDDIIDEDGLSAIELNFKRLGSLLICHCEILEGREHDEFSLARQMRLQSIREALDALPNEADGTQLSQKQKGRERQRLAALRSAAKAQRNRGE